MLESNYEVFKSKYESDNKKLRDKYDLLYSKISELQLENTNLLTRYC